MIRQCLCMRRPYLSLLFLSILILQQGCAATPQSPGIHVPSEVRANIRTVGIIVSGQMPRVTLDLPARGALSGAARGAGSWTWDWVTSMPKWVTYQVIVPGMMAVTPIVAVVGALSGAVESPSAAAVEAMETQVRRVLQDERLIGDFGNQVHNHITNRTDVIPTFLPRGGMDADDGDREIENQPDARLTIVFKSVGLQGTSDVNPPLGLYLEAEYTLVCRQKPHAAAVAVYSRRFRIWNEARTLAEWTADEASPLRKAVHDSIDRMAGHIVNDMLVPHRY